MSEKPVLAQDFDKPMNKHTRAQLLAKMEKLLRYDGDDLDSLAFERNFKHCQKLYEELERAER